MQLALEVHIDDAHGCGIWEGGLAFREQLSKNVALQWEECDGASAPASRAGL